MGASFRVIRGLADCSVCEDALIEIEDLVNCRLQFTRGAGELRDFAGILRIVLPQLRRQYIDIEWL